MVMTVAVLAARLNQYVKYDSSSVLAYFSTSRQDTSISIDVYMKDIMINIDVWK